MKSVLVKGRSGGQRLHRCITCGACDHRVDTCAFTVAGPKPFRNKLINPWTHGKTPNKRRYLQHALYFYNSCGAEAI